MYGRHPFLAFQFRVPPVALNHAMTAEAQYFRPTALSEPRINELIEKIRATNSSDLLQLAVQLRNLADDNEARYSLEPDGQFLMLSVAASVLADLTEQGWAVRVEGGDIAAMPPDTGHDSQESVQRIKARIRGGLMMSSDRQLATSATKDFITYMERPRSYDGRVVSIRSLVDDGGSLAARVAALNKLTQPERAAGLWRMIRPEVQVCDGDARCEFTGLKLLDIWRYFRHTWALEYNPVPGRTLRFLIRNKARQNSPVMGIAMLSSPAANLYARDAWIGWRTDDLIERILSGHWDAVTVAQKMLSTIRQSIAEIRTDDLATLEEIESGTKRVIFRLHQIASRAEADRRNDLMNQPDRAQDSKHLIDIRTLGSDPSNFGDDEWRRLSETALYRMKRAEQLVPLIEALRYLKESGIESTPAATLYEILVDKRGYEVVTLVLNEIRKRGLASDVADLSVCGAIAPYNHLLGGKLVALLMASQEVRDIYHARYCNQPSEISSQVAGRRVVRPSNLRLLTTTSLYGVGSSQYNRLRLRAGTVPKLFNDLSWEELAKTQGYSVTHFSKRTVVLMRKLGKAIHGRRRINSVFGEGSSPRTRQVRQGLLMLGIGHSGFLKQPSGRRVYACEAYPGAREDLIGFAKPAKRRTAARVDAIGRAWIQRWVSTRVTRSDVLERIAEEDGSSISRDLQLRILRGSSDEPDAEQFDDGGETLPMDFSGQSADSIE